jgi:TDG/mug DNA glycosylase family protein
MGLDIDVHVAPLSPAPPRDDEATHRLPDVLRDNLDVVFVGTAAGRRSADLGIYYAHGGNYFWPTLWQIGLTPRRFTPQDFAKLQNLGIGFTDLSKSGCGMDTDVVITRADLAAFDDKLRAHTPRAIAFTSKKAASLWLRRRTDRIRYGQQKRRANDVCEVFVLPSPSAAARRWWSIAPWHGLADWLRATKPWRF